MIQQHKCCFTGCLCGVCVFVCVRSFYNLCVSGRVISNLQCVGRLECFPLPWRSSLRVGLSHIRWVCVCLLLNEYWYLFVELVTTLLWHFALWKHFGWSRLSQRTAWGSTWFFFSQPCLPQFCNSGFSTCKNNTNKFWNWSNAATIH